MIPEFFQFEGKPYWSVFIEYETVLTQAEKKEPVVAKSLDEPQKVLFEKLRLWRNELAEKNKKPPFFIANNSHLCELARKAPSTVEALRQIPGFGPKKIDLYGKQIIQIIQAFYEKKPVSQKKAGRNEMIKEKNEGEKGQIDIFLEDKPS